MKLPPLSFAVLDTETTGFVPRANRIIEFACVRVEQGKIAAQFEQLFSIPGTVPDAVRVLTRIGQEEISGKPLLENKREEILGFIGKDTLIIGQNITFDIGMLKGEGIDLSSNPYVDTAMLASLVFPELESYSLGYVSSVLGLNHEPVHRAMGDVNATLELLSKCWERLNELTPELNEIAKSIMKKSAPGYNMLFGALGEAKKSKPPKWLRIPRPVFSSSSRVSRPNESIFAKPDKGEIMLIEEPVSPVLLQQMLDIAVNHAGAEPPRFTLSEAPALSAARPGWGGGRVEG